MLMRLLGLKAEIVTCMVVVSVLGVGAEGEGSVPVEERLKAKTVASSRMKRGLVGLRMTQIKKMMRRMRRMKVRMPANMWRRSWRRSLWCSQCFDMV